MPATISPARTLTSTTDPGTGGPAVWPLGVRAAPV